MDDDSERKLEVEAKGAIQELTNVLGEAIVAGEKLAAQAVENAKAWQETISRNSAAHEANTRQLQGLNERLRETNDRLRDANRKLASDAHALKDIVEQLKKSPKTPLLCLVTILGGWIGGALAANDKIKTHVDGGLNNGVEVTGGLLAALASPEFLMMAAGAAIVLVVVLCVHLVIADHPSHLRFVEVRRRLPADGNGAVAVSDPHPVVEVPAIQPETQVHFITSPLRARDFRHEMLEVLQRHGLDVLYEPALERAELKRRD